MQTLIAYWPAVVAGLYLAYVAAAGQTDKLAPAVTALVAALGMAHGGTSPLAKLCAPKK